MATMTATAVKRHAWTSVFDEEPQPASLAPAKVPPPSSTPSSPVKPAEPLAAPAPVLFSVEELLKQPVLFVKGDDLVNDTPPYPPINVQPSPSPGKTPLARAPPLPSADDQPVASTSAVPYGSTSNGLVPSSSITIDAFWPRNCTQPGPGWQNEGNTCFLNASLQAILHTPPLVNVLLKNDAHPEATCASDASMSR